MATTPEDDKTILNLSAPTVLSQEQAPALAPGESYATLPVGFRLGEFELTALIGKGGFGIVYAAYDHSLERRVALKEYMPTSLAQRTSLTQVTIREEHFAETFTLGMRSFVNEAKLLAQFDHPALVKVFRFWESNGTAYMVMPFYEGITLRQKLKEMSRQPEEAWLKQLLLPLLDALEVMHGEQCYHRDIAPDNIMLLKDGSPLLLDFGAARRVIGDKTQALTVILKPGYAPVEQYAEEPGLKQGAFTDVYALGAVLYTAIIGRPPPASVGRMMHDAMDPIAQVAAARYSDSFLRGIDRCLAIKPQDRPQSIAEMRAALGLEARMRPSAPPQPDKTLTQSAAPSSVTGPRALGSKVPLAAIVGGIAVVVIAGGAWFIASSRKDTAPPIPAAPNTAPALLSTPVQPSRSDTTSKTSFSALGALEEIFQRRNREHTVSFALDQSQVRINRDKLSFRLRSSTSGYLYLFMVGTDKRHLQLLFPNALDGNNRVEAGKELSLPRPGWAMVAGGPPGTDHFVAVVSESPRDFSGTGLQKVDPFAEFPLAQAAQIWQTHRGEYSPFLGTAACPAGATSCPQSYGAAIWTINEVN